MLSEEEKYKRIIKILRESKPDLTGIDEMAENVLQRIIKMDTKEKRSSDILDLLFGWVYIGWVRNSLITAAVFIIVLFTYQQSLILRRINSLEDRPIMSESRFVSGTSDRLDDKLFLYKLRENKIQQRRIKITESQMERFIDSYKDLQNQYEDLLKLIEEDPELKKAIESRLSEKNKKKFNL